MTTTAMTTTKCPPTHIRNERDVFRFHSDLVVQQNDILMNRYLSTLKISKYLPEFVGIDEAQGPQILLFRHSKESLDDSGSCDRDWGIILLQTVDALLMAEVGVLMSNVTTSNVFVDRDLADLPHIKFTEVYGWLKSNSHTLSILVENIMLMKDSIWERIPLAAGLKEAVATRMPVEDHIEKVLMAIYDACYDIAKTCRLKDQAELLGTIKTRIYMLITRIHRAMARARVAA